VGQLPFLVAYGGVVWRVLVGAGAVGAIACRRSRGRRQARKEALASVATWTKGITGLLEGKATVRGTLKGGTAMTLSVRRELQTRHHDDHSGALWLDCDGQRVELAGPIRVEQGTHVARARRAPRGTSDKLREAAKSDRGEHVLASVGDGDVVIACGKLSRISRDDTDYRESAGAWRLEPTSDPITLVAAAPASARPAIGVARHVATGVFAGVLVLGALYITGRVALLGREDRRHPPYLEPELPGFDRFAIAAATPWNRSEALDEINRDLENWVTRNAVSAEQLREIGRLNGGCSGEIQALSPQERPEDVLAVAKGCDDSKAMAEALIQLGRFDEAADRDPSNVEANIGAGRWRAAADALAADHDERTHQRCLEQLFRLWAGDTSARDRLHALAGHGDATCDAIAAFGLPTQAETAAALAAINTENTSFNADIQPLAWSVGVDRPDNHWDTVPQISISFDDNWFEGPCTLLAPAVLGARTLKPGSEEFEQAHVWMANYWWWRGDLNKARDEATLARGRDQDPQAEAEMMLDTLALRTGAPLPFGEGTKAARASVAARAGRPVHDTVYGTLFFHPETCEKEVSAAVADAGRGDGNHLADLMTRCNLSAANNRRLLFAALANVKSGRERLAERFRYETDWDGTEVALRTFGMLHDAVLHRDLANLLGDKETAQRYQAVIDRHFAAFADAKRVIGFLLWKM
jgi:hypothetical protein